MESGERKYESYYGEVGIVSIDEIEGSGDKVFVMADGRNVRVAGCDVEAAKSAEPRPISVVVKAKLDVMAQEIIDVLLRHELEVVYMESLWSKVGMSIENMRKVANDKLYGKDSKYELTIGDIDRVFKR
jgi:hypothetical protein